MSYYVRLSLALLIAAGAAFTSPPAFAQTGDTKSGDKPAAAQPADATKDAQRQVDEFAEATRLVNGPAGNPECVWLGRRVVGLMWRDDMDTAFRHLDLYDRFGCPGPHIQAAFRCVVRQAKPNRRASDRRGTRRRGPGFVWIGPGVVGPAGTKFSVRAGRRRNPKQGSALTAGAPRTGIRHQFAMTLKV